MAEEKQVIELTVENCPELRAAVERYTSTGEEVERILNESEDLNRAAELLGEIGLGLRIEVFKLKNRSAGTRRNEGTR